MIDLTLHGDPATCRTAATELGRFASTVTAEADTVATQRGRLGRAWSGAASAAAADRLDGVAEAARTLGTRARTLSRALDDVAEGLETARRGLTSARATAVAAGLSVSGDAIRPASAPTLPPGTDDAAVQAAATAHAARVSAYAEAERLAASARTVEADAHAALVAQVGTVTADGPFRWFLEKLGLLPGSADPDAVAWWALGGVGTGFGVWADWRRRLGVGRFAPRGPDGRFLPVQQPWYRRGPLAASDRNWVARPHQAQAYSRLGTAGTWVGRAGTVVAVGAAAWNQWEADADDPALGDAERVGRAATSGAATGAGAWAGAALGVKGGAALGMVVGGPVGAVVGGALGGLVGGALGSAAGQAVGDAVKDWAGEATQAATDALGEAWDAAGDGLSSFGDAVSFWD